MAHGDVSADWGFAENLAYASLVAANFHVRLIGQDSRRGTFFHRHAALVDQTTGEAYVPLAHVVSDPRAFTVADSLLVVGVSILMICFWRDRKGPIRAC